MAHGRGRVQAGRMVHAVTRAGVQNTHRWLPAVAITAGIVGLAAFVVVFLVLTGIIAKPETVIEGIVRALLGQ